MNKTIISSPKAISRYLNQTKKHLLLPYKHKRAMLDGLRHELLDFQLANDGCTYDELVQNFAEPCQAAHLLLENCNFEASEAYLKYRRMISRIIILSFAILLIGLTCWLVSVLSRQEVSVTEVIYEGPAHTVSSAEAVL